MPKLVWDDARYFLEIHRTRSLTGAARALKVDPSTVGRRLRALEHSLGARLFDRANDFALTLPGEAFLRRAQRIEEEFESARLVIEGHEQRLVGTLRVTAPATLGSFFFVPLLAEFSRLHPEVELELIADTRWLDLGRREADVAIRSPRPKEGSLVVRRLGEVGSGLFASRDYLERHGTPRGEDFSGHDFIGYEESFRPSAEVRWLEQHSKGANIRLRANSAHMIASAAAAGLGLGLFPCVLAEHFRGLVKVRPPVKATTSELWLVVHPELRRSARVRAFTDFLEKAMVAQRERLRSGD